MAFAIAIFNGILGLPAEVNIADIGAGGGYFSLRFAEAVGSKGKVYAIDTNQGFLNFIESNAAGKKLGDIITIIAAEDRLDLPKESLDFVFMRNITHHISNRPKYFKNLKNFLKPGGKIIIIE
jgi:ubiquinone/menaquinone biosynthesis C-methylase UbiE